MSLNLLIFVGVVREQTLLIRTQKEIEEAGMKPMTLLGVLAEKLVRQCRVDGLMGVVDAIYCYFRVTYKFFAWMY